MFVISVWLFTLMELPVAIYMVIDVIQITWGIRINKKKPKLFERLKNLARKAVKFRMSAAVRWSDMPHLQMNNTSQSLTITTNQSSFFSDAIGLDVKHYFNIAYAVPVYG
ncbi:hypothetical protein KUTeg_021432 [Tegillarca granosa]|uniref:Uncharacterized protein n=1 Tax=Tegillarca granosa TaxID=220873 RepID=A0ABQ9E399_TEGGR|nr:hypothetical protein KUTeg_021432 [Tegillarca granosa]